MTKGRQVVALFVSGVFGVVSLVAAFPSGPPAPTGPGPLRSSGPVEPVVAPLTRSQPVRVTVPRVGLDARVVAVGVNADGTPETPSLATPELAGWYRSGPSPGEAGNAVMLGHVDTYTGPAAFFELGAVVPGDLIAVTRQDSAIAQFVVDRVESYPKNGFPSDLVFGAAPTPNLRLVTCGGEFRRGSYVDNVVVTATLVPPTPRAVA